MRFFQGKLQSRQSKRVSDLKILALDFDIGNLASIVRMSKKLGVAFTLAHIPMESHTVMKIILANWRSLIKTLLSC
jgi:hypothetical protein